MQEFIAWHLVPRQVFFRMRLGEIPSDIEEELPEGMSKRIYTVTQRYADAILIYEEHVEIWEAKLIRPLAAITQLQLYEKLFRRTAEFAAYRKADIDLHLLTPIRDPDLEDICEHAGISTTYWEPDWVTEYLSSYYRISK